MRSAALAFAVILALPSIAAAQEGINDDWEGTFAGIAASRTQIPDTIHVVQYAMTWIRHEGSRRTECTTSIAGEEVETGTELTHEPVTWNCGAGSQAATRVDFWEARDHWVLTTTGADSAAIIFPRVGKKVFVDDLRPRAVQPPAPFGDSVVREVRALYARVDRYPCTKHLYSTFLQFTVCAHGDTVARVTEWEMVEAFFRKAELTYGPGGELRFAYVQYPNEGETFRYYFANGRLVRGLIQKKGGEPRLWVPSDVMWNGAEQEMLSLAKNCLVLAHAKYDRERAEDQHLLDCTVLGEH